MGVTEAAAFLTSSLLVMIGLIIVVAGVLIINNMIHRWWKSFGWSFPNFINQEYPYVVPGQNQKKK